MNAPTNAPSQAGSDLPNPDLLAISNQFADILEQAAPWIVAINASQRCSASGLVWQSGTSSTIITVDHAVRRDDEVPVLLSDGRTVTASVVGRDSSTDIAVLQSEQLSAELPAPQLSTISPRVGHLVLGAGRSSDGNLSASLGMISRLGGSWRTWQGGQIDQLIRPAFISSTGLTGGALLDSQGQLIGLNTTGPRHMTLTIPVATLQRVADQLLQTGRIARGYLGVGMQPVLIPERLVQSSSLAQTTGVMLLSIEPDSPADQAGLLIGDVLIALDAQPITDVTDVRLMLNSERIGQTLAARVIRGGAIVELNLTVGER
jgi:serine protease DegQ